MWLRIKVCSRGKIKLDLRHTAINAFVPKPIITAVGLNPAGDFWADIIFWIFKYRTFSKTNDCRDVIMFKRINVGHMFAILKSSLFYIVQTLLRANAIDKYAASSFSLNLITKLINFRSRLFLQCTTFFIIVVVLFL